MALSSQADVRTHEIDAAARVKAAYPLLALPVE